jgi:hypothetical protein
MDERDRTWLARARSLGSPCRPRFSFVGCSALVPTERVWGVDLDSLSERELEWLHAGLLKLAALPDGELRALVGSLLEGEELASSE